MIARTATTKTEETLSVGEAYRRHYAGLVGHFSKFFPNDVEDIVQNAFAYLTGWERRGGVMYEEGSKSFVFGAVKYAARRMHKNIKSNRARTFTDCTSPSINARFEDSLEAKPQNGTYVHDKRVISKSIDSAVDQLNPDLQRIFHVWKKGSSYREIAKELSMPANSVGQTLTRLRRSLQEKLRRTLPEFAY